MTHTASKILVAKAIKMAPNRREQVMRFAGPGEVFNEVGIMADSPNVVTIVALEPSVVWVIPRESMLGLLDEHPHLARRVAQNLATRVLHLARLVEADLIEVARHQICILDRQGLEERSKLGI